MPLHSLTRRFMAWVPFVASAALAALTLRTLQTAPRQGLLLALFALAVALPGYLARRRTRRGLRSGDVRSVLGAWSRGFARLPYPETMGPLVTAAAFAACGFIDQARTAMARSAKGPAWDAALEHRLFVETLLDTFEGDREGAMQKSMRLNELPLPPAGPLMKGRVRGLRKALTAFARAFAHQSAHEDLAVLERASEHSPLVHWAMRYAAAVVAIDHGKLARARTLLETAPTWPQESVYHLYHAELSQLLEPASK